MTARSKKADGEAWLQRSELHGQPERGEQIFTIVGIDEDRRSVLKPMFDGQLERWSERLRGYLLQCSGERLKRVICCRLAWKSSLPRGAERAAISQALHGCDFLGVPLDACCYDIARGQCRVVVAESKWVKTKKAKSPKEES